MYTKQQEQEKYNTNVQEADSLNYGETLIEREQIPNTPMWAVKINKEWNVTLGKWMLETGFTELEELKDDLMKNLYNYIVKIILCVTEDAKITITQK